MVNTATHHRDVRSQFGNGHTHSPQRPGCGVHIVGFKNMPNSRRAVSQRGKNQRPVADGFVTGYTDVAADM
jgi:hypothetical protein